MKRIDLIRHLEKHGCEFLRRLDGMLLIKLNRNLPWNDSTLTEPLEDLLDLVYMADSDNEEQVF